MDEHCVTDAKKITINDDVLKCMNPKDFLKFWKLQEKYLESLEKKIRNSDPNKAAVLDKIQKLTELQNEIENCRNESGSVEVSAYPVDPMVHSSITSLNEDLAAKKRLQKVLENDLQSCSYTTESQVGKMLMSKCRQLSKENQCLRQEITQGKLPQAEAELCLQKQSREQLLTQLKDYSEVSIELEQQLKDSQLKLAGVQDCFKQLFREEQRSSQHTKSSSSAGTSRRNQEKDKHGSRNSSRDASSRNK